MNLKETQNKATDIAWNNLYKRFEQEGLLPAEERALNTKKAFLSEASVRWVAVAAVVLLCITSALLIHQLSSSKADMLTLQNQDDATTLVTTLEDGSVVYLSKAASLNYPSHFHKDKREVTLQGNAFFEISKNRERPFFIDTKAAQIEVLGTAFNVISKNNEPFSLSVKHGEVRVTLKTTGQKVYVKEGETVLLESESLHKSKVSDLDMFGQYTRQIHFKDERLADIIRIINMNSDITLVLSPNLADRKLTVAFFNDTPQMMAELICMAMNLKCTVRGNMIIITPP
ncbi:FecR domain-containing protein [Dysgonomonas sp. Marseille-P4677]|uniref:FecR family protein n=1 Tax=Dysgonomonas sp. Marseille-P4677 TaxID=2364790 RepID=UPI001913BBC7|nr:FecR domain-containing protein [Dysgonomonas sp. Marseille-P4677]MBK5720897.1 FecR domain-containing protein [Dysgonomonas sp. Marseille-P4677]